MFRTQSIAVNYLDFDINKFEIKLVKHKKVGTSETEEAHRIFYDGCSPMDLVIGPRQADSPNNKDLYKIYKAYGIQKEYEYSASMKKYTNIHTGEYAVTMRLVDNPDEPTACEKKIIEVLESISNKIVDYLISNELLEEKYKDDCCRLLSYSYLKSCLGKKTSKIDTSKSPMFKTKCLFKIPRGERYENGKIPSDKKIMNTKFFDLRYQAIDHTNCVAESFDDRKLMYSIPYVRFFKVYQPNKDWCIYYRLKEALIKLIPNNHDRPVAIQPQNRVEYVLDEESCDEEF